MEHTIAQVLAQLLGIPDWAPKVIWRTAGIALVATFILAPNALREGMNLGWPRETAHIMKQMQPTLEDMMMPDPVKN